MVTEKSTEKIFSFTIFTDQTLFSHAGVLTTLGTESCFGSEVLSTVLTPDKQQLLVSTDRAEFGIARDLPVAVRAYSLLRLSKDSGACAGS